MLLVIDVGNTETVLGIYRNDRLAASWRLSSQSPKTADECWALLKTWCEPLKVDLSRLEGVVLSSVVPSLTAVFRTMCEKHLKVDPLVISADTDTGLTIRYETPRTVGADRICNAVAGFALTGGPLIVVDFGTSTTFDVVSEKGEYLGGVIALGLKRASHELHRMSAKLPRVDLEFPPGVVGRTTEASIQSGILWGTVALVDGMVDRIQAEMNWPRVHVIATGGISSLLSGKSKRIEHVKPDLTLDGMNIIFKRMK